MATTLEQLRSQYPNLSDDAIADLAGLAMKMSGSKKTRKGFLGLMKEINPEQPIPELDEVAEVDKRFAALEKRLEEKDKELKDKEFASSLASEKAAAKSKYQLSDEDMGKMEEMMKKGELPADYRFAPALFKQQTEVVEPTNYGTSGYGPLDIERTIKDNKMEDLITDTDNWASRTAHQMIDDMQRNKRASAF